MPATAEDRSAHNPLLVSSEGQTYLVGDEIYLRPAAPADAEFVQSWSFTKFPMSPDRIRARIEGGERGDDAGNRRQQLLIVRREDERPVGSLLIHAGWFPHAFVEVTMDSLFGPSTGRWKGEALALVMRLIIDEWQRPIVSVTIREDERETIAHIERVGARPCLRLPEMFAQSGVRASAVDYELLHPGWAERLGDPADAEQPRSGTGEPRPVVAPVLPEGDPPANAVRIGPRVYLRPVQESDARDTAGFRMRETDTNWSNGRTVDPPDAFWKEMKKLQESDHPEWVRFAVCLRENDTLIGFVGVEGIGYQHGTGESESEMIDPAYRGCGYGSEAKHLLFDYAFNTLGLHMLISWVIFPNTRSAAALRKQGYTDAGRLHWALFREGGFINIGIFHLRADAWRAMPRYPEGATR